MGFGRTLCEKWNVYFYFSLTLFFLSLLEFCFVLFFQFATEPCIVFSKLCGDGEDVTGHF